MTERYTPEQMLRSASEIEHASNGPCAYSKMLRQAASDAARIAELEADAEKFRALTRCMDSITVEFSGLSMTIKPAPKAHILLSAIIQGAINATDGIDAAMGERDE